MASPLSGALAKTIGAAFKGLFLDAVLTRDVEVESPDPADPLPPVEVTYRCKAIFDSYRTGHRAGGLVGSADVKALVLATSLPIEPISGDGIILNGRTVTIVLKGILGQPAVQTDPARAVWECRCLA